MSTEDIPSDMETIVAEKRRELIEAVSEVDDILAEAFLNDEPISSTELEVFSIKNFCGASNTLKKFVNFDDQHYIVSGSDELLSLVFNTWSVNFSFS